MVGLGSAVRGGRGVWHSVFLGKCCFEATSVYKIKELSYLVYCKNSDVDFFCRVFVGYFAGFRREGGGTPAKKKMVQELAWGEGSENEADL